MLYKFKESYIGARVVRCIHGHHPLSYLENLEYSFGYLENLENLIWWLTYRIGASLLKCIQGHQGFQGYQVFNIGFQGNTGGDDHNS